MDKLEIRRSTMLDAKSIQRLMNEPSVHAFYGIAPYSSQREWQLYIERANEHGFHIFTAEVSGSFRGISVISVRKDLLTSHTVSLSIAVLPEFSGMGIGRKMLEAAITFSFNWLNVRRIELEVVCSNDRAIGLYASCGFMTEGVKRQALFCDGDYCDVYMMSLLRDNFIC